MSRLSMRSGLTFAAAILLLSSVALISPVAARAAEAYTATGLAATASGSSVSATVTIRSAKPTTVAQAGVCARSSSGANVDFPLVPHVALNSTGRTLTVARILPVGTYSYWACLQDASGAWFDVGLAKTLTLTSTTMGANGARCGISIPGTHLAFQDTQAELDREMKMVADTGCAWVRFDVATVQVEATRGVRNWANIDRIVTSAVAHGLRPVATLSTLPAWSAGSWQVGPTTKTQRSAFAGVAQAAAARYAGRVDYWGIWNEPNNPGFWTSPSVAAYAALLRVAYPAVRAGNPGATVILGGTAGGQSSPNDSVDWYTGLYAAGAKGYFNAADMHPYPDSAAAGPGSGEQAVVGAVLSVMSANGDGVKLLWGTETGFPTGDANSVSEAGQAQLLMGLYDHWENVGGARVGPLFTYTLRDLPDAIGREGLFGIVRADFTEKPAYAALMARNRN